MIESDVNSHNSSSNNNDLNSSISSLAFVYVNVMNNNVNISDENDALVDIDELVDSNTDISMNNYDITVLIDVNNTIADGIVNDIDLPVEENNLIDVFDDLDDLNDQSQSSVTPLPSLITSNAVDNSISNISAIDNEFSQSPLKFIEKSHFDEIVSLSSSTIDILSGSTPMSNWHDETERELADLIFRIDGITKSEANSCAKLLHKNGYTNRELIGRALLDPNPASIDVYIYLFDKAKPFENFLRYSYSNFLNKIMADSIVDICINKFLDSFYERMNNMEKVSFSGVANSLTNSDVPKAVPICHVVDSEKIDSENSHVSDNGELYSHSNVLNRIDVDRNVSEDINRNDIQIPKRRSRYRHLLILFLTMISLTVFIISYYNKSRSNIWANDILSYTSEIVRVRKDGDSRKNDSEYPSNQKKAATKENTDQLYRAVINMKGDEVKELLSLYNYTNIYDILDKNDNNLLMNAKLNSNMEVFYALKNYQIAYNNLSEDQNKLNAIRWICLSNDYKNFRLFSDNSSVLTIGDKLRRLPIHYASLGGSIKIFEDILKFDNSMLLSYDFDGYFPVHFAAFSGSVKFFDLVISKNIMFLQLKTKINNLLPIHFAVRAENADIYQYIINKDPIMLNKNDINNMLPIHFAALYNNAEVFKLIVREDRSMIDKFNVLYQQSVHFAAGKSHEILLFLINEDDSRTLEIKNTPSLFSYYYNYLYYIPMLQRYNINKKFPIHFAAQFGSLDNVELILNRDKNMLYKRCNNKLLPSHYAAQNGRLDTFKYIIDQDKKLFYETDDKKFSIHFAIESGNIELIEFIITKDISMLNKLDYLGRSPLIIASSGCQIEVVEFLLSYFKIDTLIQDKSGKSALDHAIERNCTELIELFPDSD